MPDRHRFDDLFAEFGPIQLRRFFSGEGIYADDVMIGVIFNDNLFFKTDEDTRKAFLAEKCRPFTFVKHKSGETVSTDWYTIPDRLYDEPDELAQWARAAHAVALRSPTVQKKQRKAAKAALPARAARPKPRAPQKKTAAPRKERRRKS